LHKNGGDILDNLAFISRYEAILREKKIAKGTFYEACGISDAAVSQWRKGKTAPSMKSIGRIAGFLGVTTEYLLTGIETEKAPALTEKDKRDVAKDVYKIMESLESSGELMFDGVPMSEESKAAMAAAMRIGLEEARRRNKALYTPKKFRKE